MGRHDPEVELVSRRAAHASHIGDAQPLTLDRLGGVALDVQRASTGAASTVDRPRLDDSRGAHIDGVLWTTAGEPRRRQLYRGSPCPLLSRLSDRPDEPEDQPADERESEQEQDEARHGQEAYRPTSAQSTRHIAKLSMDAHLVRLRSSCSVLAARC